MDGSVHLGSGCRMWSGGVFCGHGIWLRMHTYVYAIQSGSEKNEIHTKNKEWMDKLD
jgi:hypothetical protein